MQQFSIYNGTVKLRRNLPFALREGHAAIDGCFGGFMVLWQIDSDDSRYPDEFAMQPFDGDVKRLADELGLSWIASGDIDFSLHSICAGDIAIGQLQEAKG